MADEEEEFEGEEGELTPVEGRSSRKSSKPVGTLECKQQQLFLIEFLIDTVHLNVDAIDPEIFEHQTCCKLKFLHFPTMDVCEKDFFPDKDLGGDTIQFNSGKSLMFALSQEHFVNPPPICLQLTVFKCVPKQCVEEGEAEPEPDHVPIGSVKICLVTLFRQIYEEYQKHPDDLPLSKSMKDTYIMTAPGKKSTGDVGIYIRISCLGQNIVTEFQCGADMKVEPVLFKSKQGKKVFECKSKDPPSEDALCPGAAPGKVKSRLGAGFGEGMGGYPGGYTSGAPTGYGTDCSVPDGNRIVFDMPTNADRCRGDHNVVEYKVTNQTNVYQVTPGSLADHTRTKDGRTEAQLTTDPSKNVFVLRVGDKEKKCDKPKMMLELRTPKQKIDPVILPPYHEDVEVQTEKDKKKKKKKKK